MPTSISEAAIRRAAETMALLDPAKGARAGAAAPDQPPRSIPTPIRSSLVPFAEQGRALPDRSTPPPAPAIRASRRSRSASPASWSVIEIVRADGFVAHRRPPAGAPQRVRSSPSRTAGARPAIFGLGGRYLYDDLFEPATWNRAIDEALAQALVNLESVAAPAGEMTVRARPRLARRAAARSGRPRPRRRFQPQGHLAPSPAGSASASPRPASPWSTTARSPTAAAR